MIININNFFYHFSSFFTLLTCLLIFNNLPKIRLSQIRLSFYFFLKIFYFCSSLSLQKIKQVRLGYVSHKSHYWTFFFFFFENILFFYKFSKKIGQIQLGQVRLLLLFFLKIFYFCSSRQKIKHLKNIYEKIYFFVENLHLQTIFFFENVLFFYSI